MTPMLMPAANKCANTSPCAICSVHRICPIALAQNSNPKMYTMFYLSNH